MRTTFGIGFYCRNSKTDRKGKAPVEIGLTLNGKRVFISLPRKEIPSNFKSEMTKKRENDLIAYCKSMETNINRAMTELQLNGTPVTAENIKLYVQTGGIRKYTLGNLFDDYLSYLRKRIGVDLTRGAYRKYEIAKTSFFENSGLDEDSELAALTPSVIMNYYAELRKTYKTSSSASYMVKLKTIIKYGMDNGKFTVNPFQGVRIKQAKPNITVLSEEEIEKIKNAPLSNSLGRIRDCFLFQIYSGLSFADLEQLRKKDIKEENGICYIRKNRVKTGVEYTAVLLPGAKEIMDAYGDRLPLIRVQKVNEYLHTIERLTGVGKSLHSHLGRHTYAYLLLNKYGIRAEVAAKAMGHTSPKTTLKYYADITANTTIREIGSKIGA